MSARRKQLPPDRRTGRAALVWLSLLVAGATLVVFVPCLFNGFSYDDQWIILENPHYRGLGPVQFRWMFTTFYMGHWQPLTWVSLGLDYCLWGMNPCGYHLTSLILHSANAVLVYWLALILIRRALQRPGRSGSRPATGVQLGALLAALVFALHPLRVESVAWVTDRADVLATCFLLLTVLAYLRAHPLGETRIRRAWLSAAVLLYGLSLMTRGMGVMLPVVLLLLDWYPLRRVGLRSGASRPAKLAPVLWEKIPFVVLAIAIAMVAALAKTESGSTMPLSEHGLLSRVAQASYGLVFYIHKTLLPTGLVPMYELHPPLNLFSARHLIPLLTVAAALAVLLLYGRRIPAVTTAVLSYGVLLFPLLGFVQAGQQEVADRYCYCPSIGWALLAGGTLAWLWGSGPTRAKLAWVAAPAGFLFVAVWAVLTWRQCTIWRTEESLWTHAVANGPPCSIAHYNLACVLAYKDETLEALKHLQTSLRIKPNSVKARYNLGNALNELGRRAEAVEAYRAVLAIEPQHAGAAHQLGNALLALERLDDAEAAYRRALQSDSHLVEARMNLGSALIRQRRFEEGAEVYREVLALEPGRAEAHYNLGNCLAFLGRVDQAIAAYHQAIELEPQLLQAHVNLGSLLQRQGRLREAAAAYRTALRLDPAYADARCNLAVVLSRQGNIDAAIAQFREVLRSDPNHAGARRGLESLQKRKQATPEP